MMRCEKCGGRLDRPGLFACQAGEHPIATTAERIARAIERDIRDRRGLRQEFEAVDCNTQDEIRDAWVAAIRREIGKQP